MQWFGVRVDGVGYQASQTPDSGLGVQVKVLTTLQVGRGRGTQLARWGSKPGRGSPQGWPRCCPGRKVCSGSVGGMMAQGEGWARTSSLAPNHCTLTNRHSTCSSFRSLQWFGVRVDAGGVGAHPATKEGKQAGTGVPAGLATLLPRLQNTCACTPRTCERGGRSAYRRTSITNQSASYGQMCLMS